MYQQTALITFTPPHHKLWRSQQADQSIIKHNLLNKSYRYRLRPGYGSDKLLLEFLLTDTDSEFYKDLFATLKDLNPKVDTVDDLWMNDEVLLQVSSDNGNFTLSKDIWDFAFIMTENNQPFINLIDEILQKSSLFKKEEVDFENYKHLKT